MRFLGAKRHQRQAEDPMGYTEKQQGRAEGIENRLETRHGLKRPRTHAHCRRQLIPNRSGRRLLRIGLGFVYLAKSVHGDPRGNHEVIKQAALVLQDTYRCNE